MSLSYTVDVHCDRCHDWVGGVTGPKPKAREALAQAKKEGWSRVTKDFYTDLCPKCLAEARSGKEIHPKPSSDLARNRSKESKREGEVLDDPS